MKLEDAIETVKKYHRWRDDRGVTEDPFTQAERVLVNFTEKALGEHRGFLVKGKSGVAEITNDMYKAMIEQLVNEVEQEYTKGNKLKKEVEDDNHEWFGGYGDI